MKVALFGKTISRENLPYIVRLLEKLNRDADALFIYKPFNGLLSKSAKISYRSKTFNDHQTLRKDKVDFLISVGGDGTFLQTIDLVRDSGIPVIGINTGRLGFLSSVPKDKAAAAIDELMKKNYSVEKRALIRMDVKGMPFGEVNYALNEVTVLKNSSSMITIHSRLNGEFLNSYWADGLIISTPTGSTAYSMSCSGPIVTPDSQNFIISPIAPHNLNVRPIVIPDTNTVKLSVESRNNQFLATLDSRSVTLDTNAELTLKKCDFQFNLIRLDDQRFLSMLRNKLMWGQDIRHKDESVLWRKRN